MSHILLLNKKIQKIPGFRPSTRNPEPKTNPSRNPEFTIFDPEPGFSGRVVKPGKTRPGAHPFSEPFDKRSSRSHRCKLITKPKIYATCKGMYHIECFSYIGSSYENFRFDRQGCVPLSGLTCWFPIVDKRLLPSAPLVARFRI